MVRVLANEADEDANILLEDNFVNQSAVLPPLPKKGGLVFLPVVLFIAYQATSSLSFRLTGTGQ